MLGVLDREGADAAGAGMDQDALACFAPARSKPCSVVSPTSGSDAASACEIGCRLERDEVFAAARSARQRCRWCPGGADIDGIARLEFRCPGAGRITTPLASKPNGRGNLYFEIRFRSPCTILKSIGLRLAAWMSIRTSSRARDRIGNFHKPDIVGDGAIAGEKECAHRSSCGAENSGYKEIERGSTSRIFCGPDTIPALDLNTF